MQPSTVISRLAYFLPMTLSRRIMCNSAITKKEIPSTESINAHSFDFKDSFLPLVKRIRRASTYASNDMPTIINTILS